VLDPLAAVFKIASHRLNKKCWAMILVL